jgi:hypothetical protein
MKRWHRLEINISAPERAERIFIGIAAVVARAVLLSAASSVLAMTPEVVLVVAGLDLAVTGAMGYCPLYARLGHVPRSIRSST